MNNKLGNFVKINNMRGNNGKEIVNQFEITTDKGVVFQSYNSIIAVIFKNGSVLLDEKYWDYSQTTSTYRNLFLMEDTKTTKSKITSGKYLLTNLND